jgi:hypothetical protein
LDKPIAIACLRFLCSPRFKCRISVATSSCALGPYRRRLELLDDARVDGLLPPEDADLPSDADVMDRVDDDLREEPLFAAARLPDLPAPERADEDLPDDFIATAPRLDLREDDDRLRPDLVADDLLRDNPLLDDLLALDFFVAIRASPLDVSVA